MEPATAPQPPSTVLPGLIRGGQLSFAPRRADIKSGVSPKYTDTRVKRTRSRPESIFSRRIKWERRKEM